MTTEPTGNFPSVQTILDAIDALGHFEALQLGRLLTESRWTPGDGHANHRTVADGPFFAGVIYRQGFPVPVDENLDKPTEEWIADQDWHDSKPDAERSTDMPDVQLVINPNAAYLAHDEPIQIDALAWAPCVSANKGD